MGKVLVHPLPAGCSPELAELVAKAVRGAVMAALDAHYPELSRQKRGSLIGSIGKRAVNQLCCEEGRERIKQVLAS